MTDICHFFFRVQYNFAEQINTYKYNYDDFQKNENLFWVTI